ncbi:MAG: sporulation protein [Turicibacter sp.]|nr:sporulation protein [Turicibacter sp.]
MKNIMKSVVLLLFLVILLLQPAPIITATKTGFITWVEKVIPSLFPFFVLTRLMIYYQVPQLIGKLLAPLFKYLLHLSPITFFVMFLSLISGNPSGSKMARDYYDQHLISLKEMEGLMYFCNFSSPLFIIGTVGVVLYQSTRIGYLLLMVHLLGSLAVFIYCYPLLRSKESIRHVSIEFPTQSFSTILIDCIESSIQTLIRVGGIIVFFYIISEALKIIHFTQLLDTLLLPLIHGFGLDSTEPLIAGILEFTQGVTKVSQTEAPIQTKLVLTAFILSFTGLSVHTQSFMFAKNLNISYLKYLMMRLLHGCTSATILFFTWQRVLKDEINVFSPIESTQLTTKSLLIPFMLGLLSLYFILKAYHSIKRRVLNQSTSY